MAEKWFFRLMSFRNAKSIFVIVLGLVAGLFGGTDVRGEEGTMESAHEPRYVTPPVPLDPAEPPPPKITAESSSSDLVGPIGPSATQAKGSLYGRIVYMSCGHGWTYDAAFPWRLQRGTGNSMNEDYGNRDQLNFFAAYCFNAGATVVPMRPIGNQTNEVVLDNDSAGVSFTGSWSDNTSATVFWGSAGDAVTYRFATLSATETATAVYTPTIPKEGFYPVYTWVSSSSNRGLQLYRIRHTGGEAQVRIPHHMVGNGWVYLGEYHFNAGSNALTGAVVISNLRETAQGSVVIADGIRFGNGMGSIVRGTSTSGHPREDECTRYWVQAGLGVGMASSLYDTSGNDEEDSWSAPGRMSAAMNNEASGSFFKRIHISFHSNAGNGNGRGVVGLITGGQHSQPGGPGKNLRGRSERRSRGPGLAAAGGSLVGPLRHDLYGGLRRNQQQQFRRRNGRHHHRGGLP